MKQIALTLATLFIILFSYDSFAKEQERTVLKNASAMQEKIKSSQDEKNVVSGTDDHDDDTLIKNSDDSFDLNQDPDDCIL